MADGLSADHAARVVGVSRATLYRWTTRAEPQSRRPVRVCKPSWTPALAKAVEQLRAANPTWGKRKLAVLLRREGVAVSNSTGIQSLPSRKARVGGSEFMADFEKTCAARRFVLSVLPPIRPQLNGGVVRAQNSWRYKFYGCFDLPHSINKLQAHVDALAHRYNHHRPHQALGDRTPAEYLGHRLAMADAVRHKVVAGFGSVAPRRRGDVAERLKAAVC